MAEIESRQAEDGGLVADRPRASAVERSVEGLRRLIAEGQLLPGEQIRQAEMAELLSVSRVPLREALKALETEGTLLHRQNQGYFVAKLGAFELEQIYLMRGLLESELLRQLRVPSESELAGLIELNERLADAVAADDLSGMMTHNQAFHFAIFELSDQDVVRREVERLWRISDSYRSSYLYDVAARHRVLDEHVRIIDALATGDRDELVRVSDEHRAGVVRHFSAMRPGRGAREAADGAVQAPK